MKIIGGEKDEE